MPQQIHHRLFIGIAFLITLPLGCSSKDAGSGERADSQSGDAIQWIATWPEAQKQASAGNKLIMIDFYTDWCTWCKVLDKKTYPDPKVVKLAAELVSIKLDAEKNPGSDLARKYKVEGYPAIVFVDADGRPAGLIDGYYPPDEFAKRMKDIIAKHRK